MTVTTSDWSPVTGHYCHCINGAHGRTSSVSGRPFIVHAFKKPNLAPLPSVNLRTFNFFNIAEIGNVNGVFTRTPIINGRPL